MCIVHKEPAGNPCKYYGNEGTAVFSNLYGITPLYRALRIIQKQNPELGLTKEEFLSSVNEIEREEHYYIFVLLQRLRILHRLLCL